MPLRASTRPLVAVLAASATTAAVLLVTASALGPTPVTAQPTACRFVSGFAALRDLVGATRVGNCLEDEYVNAANGNTEQHTTGGLLVWRQVDNWTAFTDGHETWINGPEGLARRLNTDRFAWERDPLTTAATSPAAPRPAASPTAVPPRPSPSPSPSASTTAPPSATPSTPAPPTVATGGAAQGVAPVDRDNCPSSHPIKGNREGAGPDRPGDPTYHLPDSRSYRGANPEVCFASAADAEAAGYRPPNP